MRHRAMAIASAALCVLALCPLSATAGQIRESDLVIHSQAGRINTISEGDRTTARTDIHTVRVTDDSRTGDISVTGRVDKSHTQAGGQNTSAASSIGGVNVGDK